MKDQRSASKKDDEPKRPAHIPDNFIWYPDMRAWDAPPAEASSGWDVEAWMREYQEELDNRSAEERRKGLISVDQLRAAGALDVPPAWRKSLGDEERDLFDELPEDDRSGPKKRLPAELDAGDETSADADS